MNHDPPHGFRPANISCCVLPLVLALLGIGLGKSDTRK